MLDYFRSNPPEGIEEFEPWWNTMQMELHDKDVPQVPYSWNCTVCGECRTLVPEWMLLDDELLSLLRDSTKNMVLRYKELEDGSEEQEC